MGVVDPLPLGEQAVQSGDSDVVERIDLIAEQFGADPGLFRHRKI